jgi:hypothetical protein
MLSINWDLALCIFTQLLLGELRRCLSEFSKRSSWLESCFPQDHNMDGPLLKALLYIYKILLQAKTNHEVGQET